MEPLDELIKYLLSTTSLSEKEVRLLCSFSQTVKLNKGDYFQEKGLPVSRIGYLASGLFKEESANDSGRLFIERFIREKGFLSDFGTYLHRCRATFSLCAIVPSEVIYITFGDIEKARLLIPTLESEIINLSCHSLLKTKCDRCRFLYSTPLENYHHFLSDYSDIVHLLPEGDVAMYLHITPSSFSRLKKSYNELQKSQNREYSLYCSY